MEVLANVKVQGKEINGIQIEKEVYPSIKLSLFTDIMISQVENLKELTNKTSPNISCHYKVNTQKLAAFLYTRNVQMEFEIKNITIYLGTPKQVQDRYEEL